MARPVALGAGVGFVVTAGVLAWCDARDSLTPSDAPPPSMPVVPAPKENGKPPSATLRVLDARELAALKERPSVYTGARLEGVKADDGGPP
jgi:hypothetical protein